MNPAAKTETASLLVRMVHIVKKDMCTLCTARTCARKRATNLVIVLWFVMDRHVIHNGFLPKPPKLQHYNSTTKILCTQTRMVSNCIRAHSGDFQFSTTPSLVSKCDRLQTMFLHFFMLTIVDVFCFLIARDVSILESNMFFCYCTGFAPVQGCTAET